MTPSLELVHDKVRKFWPNDIDRVLAQLETLRNPELSAQSLARIQLAVLKLSEGSDEQLQQNIAAATRDYRDVIAYAEYPKNMAANHLNHFDLTDEEASELKAIRKSDREQYQTWLMESEPD